ncbi:SpoIIE family protein phosphatase [Streptantibioticus cattleyicolor]|uniref:Uncharacterized protein n=1 Tax=Streptantibioticus cattleyicolor (strain ATCC 35852 / DSM 46488 / JCM 4925 / NBRC 14057 / NRRL 8057) TaxID=1003195 RepID=F8JMG6_STREN|nr:SpoIIE family protein phosphatase [Streptantibioticus cattleyicolor]AEW99356.1 hypothetical protein SCATT_p11630 [Streptantibioticus cattleyicolor NRRL 8057 = DSM 46488]CCB71604.1 Magnesium or manganese-dependent protein phosphatase [Streptantibioticus cattleyicolor NRRL 8057 = DSM 46488]
MTVPDPAPPDDGPPRATDPLDPGPADEAARLAATVERLRARLADAEYAAATHALAGVAKGVLMERLGCDQAEATRQLERLARESGLPPAELCADIVGHSAVPPQAPARGAGALRTAEAGMLAADDTRAAARVLLDQALAPLGAVAVAVWAAAPDGTLTLAGQAGFPGAEEHRWCHVPPGVTTLARRALDERRDVRVTTATAEPTIGAGQFTADACRVVVPAEYAGRLLGVLEVCWPGPAGPFPPAVHRQLRALAEVCAHTLTTVPATPSAPSARPVPAELAALAEALPDPALILLPLLDADGTVADFRIAHANERFTDPAGRPRTAVTGLPLLEAYPTAARGGGLSEAAHRVYATGEPHHGTRVRPAAHAPTLTAGIGRVGEALLLTWRPEDDTTARTALLEHAQRLGRIGGFEENLITGRILWNSQLHELFGLEPTAPPIPLTRLRDHAHPDDTVALSRFLRTVLHHQRPASTAFRLRRADGVVRHLRVVAEPVADGAGLPTAVRGVCQDVSAQHWTEIALAATRAELADAEQRSAESDRLALQLQRAIMPPEPGPKEVAGLEIVVRYRPAQAEHLVGGDWYDAVRLPDGRVLLAVGDVAGHGIGAVTGMVALRNALRGLAATGAGPARLLGWLNSVTHHLTERVTATAVCGVYHPGRQVLTWARAGHLPPLLVRDGVATALPRVPGLLLGAVPRTRYREHTLELRSGDTLLMYTDGLIERRDRSVDHSLRQLLGAAQHPRPGLADQLDHLLLHSKADTDDDTCLVGVRLP